MLARMETDDAVDLLLQLDEPRRDPILALLPAVQQRRVRACSVTTLRRRAA